MIDRNARRRWTRWLRTLLLLILVLSVWGRFAPAVQAHTNSVAPVAAADGDETNFFLQVLHNLFDGPKLMRTLGQPEYTLAAFVALNVIIFVETGLLVGFCLPGDSLLVTAGLVCAESGWNLPLLLLTLCASAIIGDTVGYWIGFSTGPKIFCREQSFLFHKNHLLKAQQFYEKHGGKTIILARFIPILRTFAPVVAGVGRMQYGRFLSYNVVGGIGWVCSMVLLGYFLPSTINPLLQPILGPEFSVQKYIEVVIVLVVLASISPGIVMWLKNRLGRSSKPVETTAMVEAK
jgi:membrane-associated protein